MELVEEAGKKLLEFVGVVGVSYLSAVVADAFQPAIADGISGALDDAKSALFPDDRPTLAEDKDEKLPDGFYVEVTDAHVIEPRFGPEFLAYTVYAVRVGHFGGEFYVNAKHFRVRYRQLALAPEKIKHDHKDAKLEVLPAPYKFGGTVCFCIKQEKGDLNAHKLEVKNYFKAIQKAPYSEGLASHFRVGRDWQAQQAAKLVFFAALASTAQAEGLPAFTPSIEPFDESEAILDLLRHFAVEKHLPGILSAVEGQDVPAPLKKQLRETAQSALNAAIETAGKAWEPAQVAASKAGQVVTKKCQEGADKIVDHLKPVLARVVALIQAKMAKKAGESKVDEAKEHKKAPGVYVGAWKLEKTHIGKSFHKRLTAESPVDAIKQLTADVQKSLKIAVQTPLSAAADSLGGGDFAKNPWVQKHIGWLTKRIVDFILEVTTLDAMLDVAHKMAESVHRLEEEGEKAASGERLKWVQKVSETLWNDLSSEATDLYIKTCSLESKILSLFSGEPASVSDPLVSLLGDTFNAHVRGLNGIRILFVQKLKASIESAKDVKTASRQALRDSIFESAHILAGEHWTRALSALKTASQAMLIAKFEEEVWPEVKEGLAELDELIPDELKSLGLSISSLAFKVACMIISSGAGWAFGKIAFRLEEAMFDQHDSGEGAS